jgi:hypothetical protein
VHCPALHPNDHDRLRLTTHDGWVRTCGAWVPFPKVAGLEQVILVFAVQSVEGIRLVLTELLSTLVVMWRTA